MTDSHGKATPHMDHPTTLDPRLFTHEARAAATAWRDHDWPQVRAHLHRTNPFGSRTHATTTRLASELLARLSHLTGPELDHLATCDGPDATHLTWVALLRRNTLVHDFAFVLADARITRRPRTTHTVDRFLTRQALWHASIDDLPPTRRAALITALITAARNAHLLTHDGTIHRPLLTPRLHDLLTPAQNT